MKPATAASAVKVQKVLGPAFRVLEFEAPTRSAADAAAAVGCSVGCIAKSLVFRAASGRPVLVIASGGNRVDETRLSSELGEPVERADADFVRESTGYSIGGVPPVGHRINPEVFIDEDLMSLNCIWAAAGTPNAVFPLEPAELLALTGGRVTRVKP
jgi:prolyl-tRNA editing enzyme YbaK/EbsC (Cys-tRNA(Pro) deacylase)